MFHNYLVFFVVAYSTINMVCCQVCVPVPGLEGFPCTFGDDTSCPGDEFANPPFLPVCGADLVCCVISDAVIEDTTTTAAPVAARTTTKKTATCVDQINPKTGVSDCPMRREQCDDPVYDEVMTRQCPLTCNRCDRIQISVLAVGCVDQLNPRTGVSDCPMRKNLCTDPKYNEFMHRQCPKTCGFCTGNNNSNNGTENTGKCEDRINPATGISDCSARLAYCTKPEYRQIMMEDCRKTCGFC